MLISISPPSGELVEPLLTVLISLALESLDCFYKVVYNFVVASEVNE